MSERQPRLLVADTSVAVKFYLVEEGHEDALEILDAAEEKVELIAPSTILPEGFNAIRRQERRGVLDVEDARNAWDDLLHAPNLYLRPGRPHRTRRRTPLRVWSQRL